MKIITIIGARPQFIKAAVVSRAVQENNLISKIQKLKKKLLILTNIMTLICQMYF